MHHAERTGRHESASDLYVMVRAWALGHAPWEHDRPTSFGLACVGVVGKVDLLANSAGDRAHGPFQ